MTEEFRPFHQTLITEVEPQKLEVLEAPAETLELTAPPPYDPHADWDKFITSLRESIIQQEVKRTGRSPVPNPVPMVALDDYGRPLKYAEGKDKKPRYAFDAYGRLSLPRQKGKIKPHHSKKKLAIKEKAIAEFRHIFHALSAEIERRAKVDGTEFQGVPVHLMGSISEEAVKKAARQFKVDRRAERKARRARHRLARRINFGLIAGNADRRAHAAH